MLSIEYLAWDFKKQIKKYLDKHNCLEGMYHPLGNDKRPNYWSEENSIDASMKDFNRSSFLFNGCKINMSLTNSMVKGYSLSSEGVFSIKGIPKKDLKLKEQFYNKGKSLSSKSKKEFLIEAFKYMFDVSGAKVPNDELLTVLVCNMNQEAFTTCFTFMVPLIFVHTGKNMKYGIGNISISCDREDRLEISISYHKGTMAMINEKTSNDIEFLKTLPTLDGELTFQINSRGNGVIEYSNIKVKSVFSQGDKNKGLTIDYDITEYLKNKNNLLHKIMQYIMYFVHYIKEFFNKIIAENNSTKKKRDYVEDYSEPLHRLFKTTDTMEVGQFSPFKGR